MVGFFANFLRPLRPSDLSSRDFTSFADTLIFADRIEGEGTHHRGNESWGTEVSSVPVYLAVESLGHELVSSCGIGAPPKMLASTLDSTVNEKQL